MLKNSFFFTYSCSKKTCQTHIQVKWWNIQFGILKLKIREILKLNSTFTNVFTVHIRVLFHFMWTREHKTFFKQKVNYENVHIFWFIFEPERRKGFYINFLHHILWYEDYNFLKFKTQQNFFLANAKLNNLSQKF